MANLANIILQGTRTNQPAAGLAGRLYCVTDEDNLVERDNGTSWVEFAGGVAAPTGGADILEVQVFS